MAQPLFAVLFAAILSIVPISTVPCEPDVYDVPASVQRYGWEISHASYTHQVPEGLIARVLWIESKGQQYALSPAGARGLMQVMPFWFKPGESMYDAHTNVEKGAYVLRTNYDRYGTWRRAAMAYLGLWGADYWGTTAAKYVQLIFRRDNGC